MTASARSTSCLDADPEKIVDSIRAGKWAPEVRAVRDALAASGKEAADEMKKRLPGILFAGTFDRRANEGLREHAGLLCADLDGIGERIGELHDALRADPHVAACFISPSGNGLKVVFRVRPDADLHARSFAAVRQRLREAYGVAVDEKAKDVARLCFVSHDPAAWFNADATPLEPLTETLPLAPVARHAPRLNGDTLPPTAERLLANGAPQGERNARAFDLACQCRDAGKTEGEAEATVCAFAGRCSPPLAEGEARAAVASAYSKPARQPARGNGAANWIATASTPDAPTLRPLTIWRPSQFLAWTEPPGSHFLLPAYLTRGELTTLIGQGGLGKSRLALWLAICQILGREWCGLQTAGEPQKWLFLGDENSIARLKEDLQRMFSALTPDEIARVDEYLRLPALLGPDDGDVWLGDASTQARILLTLEQEAPGVIVADPLGNFAPGDISKPGDMKEAVRTLLSIFRRGAPQAADLLLHHARTGRANIAQGVGWDAANFGSGGKALFASARCQLNLMPGKADDDTRLVLHCAKANNCPRFQTRGLVFDPRTFAYSPDADFDGEAWQADVEGRAQPGQSLCTVAEVTSAVRDGYATTKALVDHLTEACATSKSTVERIIRKAARCDAIKPFTRGKFILGSKSARYLEKAT